MNEADAIAGFAALAQETRLGLVRHLVRAGPEGMRAGDLAAAVGATPSRASFHLSALAEAGLVTTRREARTIRYTASYATLGALVAFMLDDCCQGDETVRACCASVEGPPG